MKRRKHEKQKNKKTNREDRLSDLPDSIIFHILCFLTAKEAIQTCKLSKRWKNLWKNVPQLRLNSEGFKTLNKFNKFVSRVLPLRYSSTAALKALSFAQRGRVNPNQLKRIVKFAHSHNVNRLGLYCYIPRIEPSLFSSHTLKELSLMCPVPNRWHTTPDTEFLSNISLPALTRLNLWFVAFRAGEDGFCEPFSRFSSLKSLFIQCCFILDGKSLRISSTTLVDLFINLSIDDWVEDGYPKIDLYVPNLCTFVFHGNPFTNLTGSNLSSLKHLDIDLYESYDNDLILLNSLIELIQLVDHIESLTVSVDTLQVLWGPFKWKWNVNLPSFCNMKLLKVKKQSDQRLPDGMVEMLLQNAPFAKLCIDNVLRTCDY